MNTNEETVDGAVDETAQHGEAAVRMASAVEAMPDGEQKSVLVKGLEAIGKLISKAAERKSRDEDEVASEDESDDDRHEGYGGESEEDEPGEPEGEDEPEDEEEDAHRKPRHMEKSIVERMVEDGLPVDELFDAEPVLKSLAEGLDEIRREHRAAQRRIEKSIASLRKSQRVATERLVVGIGDGVVSAITKGFEMHEAASVRANPTPVNTGFEKSVVSGLQGVFEKSFGITVSAPEADEVKPQPTPTGADVREGMTRTEIMKGLRNRPSADVQSEWYGEIASKPLAEISAEIIEAAKIGHAG